MQLLLLMFCRGCGALLQHSFTPAGWNHCWHQQRYGHIHLQTTPGCRRWYYTFQLPRHDSTLGIYILLCRTCLLHILLCGTCTLSYILLCGMCGFVTYSFEWDMSFVTYSVVLDVYFVTYSVVRDMHFVTYFVVWDIYFATFCHVPHVNCDVVLLLKWSCTGKFNITFWQIMCAFFLN